MKVSLIGFSLESENGYLTLPYFFSYLEGTKNNKKIVYNHCTRYFFLNGSEHPDYWVGMIITVKDQRSYLKFKEEMGRHIIKRANLHGSEKLLDFNFFAIDKQTGYGIYTHYHHSCAIRELGAILKRWFYEARDSLKSREEKKPNSSWISLPIEKLRGRINRRYKGRLVFAIISRKDGLGDMLSNLEKIKNVEVVLDAFTPSAALPGVPVVNKSKRVREKFIISPGWSVDALIQDVVELADLEGLSQGRVLGVNSDGNDEVVQFFKAPNNFGEYDYDDITQKIDNLEVDVFYTHDIFEELIQVLESEENESIFQAEIEED